MTRAEWGRTAGIAAFIAALYVIGWFTLIAIIAPEHYSLGTKTFGIGIGVTAYTWACGTPSTPTTSPRSTTPPAS
jgi:high-affinity nickel-transport protein